MNDLFSYDVTRKTRRQAFKEMTPHLGRLRRIAMEALNRLGTGTAAEVAAASGLAREAIQPRVSELLDLRLAEPAGERRRNPTGKTAAVVQLTGEGRATLAAAKTTSRPDL